MTPTQLKHLQRNLNGPERLAAILNASSRDDELDRARLVSTAPVNRFKVKHHYGPSQGLANAAHLYVTSQLESLVLFWRAEAGAAEAWDDAEFDQWCEAIEVAAVRFVTAKAAWHQFCASLAIDPDQMIRVLSPLLLDAPDQPTCEQPPDLSSVDQLAEAYRTEFDRMVNRWA